MKDIKKYFFPKITSTNDWAKKNAHLFDPQKLTLVMADQQTKGRGRFGRKWHSPAKKNIYASIVFFLPQERHEASWLVQLLAKSVQQVLVEEGVHVDIKWPNDLLIGQKKLAGILLETSQCHDNLCIVMGIGINVNTTKHDLLNVGQPATSLFIETGKLWDRNLLIDQIVHALLIAHML